ncbi:catalase-related domain-containing protein [Dyadobacter subterraneus]|uniref:Catalase immune-responsive domain-containing protein n=1 Tax=Dyadobacter subterraneus TaxID=2773304 RepID=A0ABR9WLR7_9BACT|nr:catalase-related domain-containing protein [Dyadobacter subterraneus]MBE9466467.1 hypothetical protein [Dyadobacter subterraneus]
MSDNTKRSGVNLGNGIRFKQGFASDTESAILSDFSGISPLIMNLNAVEGFAADEEDYNLPGLFYREMLSDDDRANLVCNIICSLQGIDNPQKENIIKEQLYHFFKIDTKLGLAVADGLKVKVGALLLSR